jgi:anti-sigma factor RsiW
MSCDEIEELLSDLIDDELADGARAGVEAHLASCERCAATYHALKRTVRFVRANADAGLLPGTPGGAYQRFTRAVTEGGYGRGAEDVIDDVLPGAARTDGGS